MGTPSSLSGFCKMLSTYELIVQLTRINQFENKRTIRILHDILHDIN